MAHKPGNRHIPNTRTRRIVREAAQHGVSEVAICAILGAHLRRQSPIGRDVLRRQYKQELEQGRAEGLWRVAATVYARATGSDGAPPDFQAAKFWLERRDPENWAEGPRQVEIGRPGEFSRLTDAELVQEVEAVAGRLGLPAPDADILPVNKNTVAK